MTDAAQALYWGVDEHGLPYPLNSMEEWHSFYNQHADRIDVGWDEWDATTGEHIEISTKFFGTDISTPGHPQRCMFETATFVAGKLKSAVRVETREDAEMTHSIAKVAARVLYPPAIKQDGSHE